MNTFIVALVGIIVLGMIAVFISSRNQRPRSEVEEIVDEIEIIEEEI